MNTAEILRAAAARVRQGWCQLSMVDSAGRVCALGALEDTLNGDWWLASEVASEVEQQLQLSTTKDEYILRPLAYWNDADGQTAENVAQGLELAALLWEQEQQQSTSTPEATSGVCA